MKENFLVDDDQENVEEIPDPDEALKEALTKLKAWKVSRFRDFQVFAKYISSRQATSHQLLVQITTELCYKVVSTILGSATLTFFHKPCHQLL